jgi:heme-degrading monooxygenase HmoA
VQLEKDGDMVIRVWRAQSQPQNVEKYARHLRESVLPQLGRMAGHRGAYLLRRDQPAHVELLVLTLWDSMESVRQFAGSSPDTAVVEPAAQAVLESFDAIVQHFQVVLATASP